MALGQKNFEKACMFDRQQDYQMAFSHYMRAAEWGHAEAQNMVGIYYDYGRGTAQNYKKAVGWYEKAAAQNVAVAFYNLGDCYTDGKGVEQNKQKAFEHYLRSAELGYAEAQNMVGVCYYDGRGTAQNYKKAVGWYEKAAAQNVPVAFYNLGNCYTDGTGVEQNQQKAFEHYLRSAELGYANGQNRTGSCYYFGRGTAQNYKKAVGWYEKAAAQNVAVAFNSLGICYADGKGVEQNQQKAFEHYLRAAELGHAKAQNVVGVYYATGKGVAQNYKKAIEWYKKAAAQNVPAAFFNLGMNYENGNGVAQNWNKALELYAKAIALGYQKAADRSAKLREKLNNKQAQTPTPAAKQVQTPILTAKQAQTPTQAAKKAPLPQSDPNETPALKQLRAMIGLESVKQEVEGILEAHKMNQEMEALGLPVPEMSLHMVFTGNPGTGKTTVARLIGKIYHELGLLEKDTVKEVKRKDLVSDVIGGTEKLTTAAIEEAKGGILFIDEAYTLTPENAGNDFGLKAVETLMAEMENHRKDLVVIVAGYTMEMNRFLNSDPGLNSRFTKTIHFEDYNASDMCEIFKKMAGDNKNTLEEGTDALLRQYFDWIDRTKTKNFGNARDVRNFYEAVIMQRQKRLRKMETRTREDYTTIRRDDIQEVMDEKMGKLDDSGDPMKELNLLIGLGSVKKEVRSLWDTARYYQMCISNGLPAPNRPVMHMVFMGNPGTGKTTVARLIGQIYNGLGMLPTKNVTEVKREDLVAGYYGHTAPKTKKMIERAMGGVLFIDEAYTLAPKDERDFGLEAIDTLLAEMENNRENLAVIVAGYTDEMRRFINANSGLKSRFTKYIQFDDYTPEEMAEIFYSFAKNYTFGKGAKEELNRIFTKMYDTRDKNFGNGRDVRNFYDTVISCMAKRLVAQEKTSPDELIRITREDMQAAEKMHKTNAMH